LGADTVTGRGYEQVTPADKDFGFGQASLFLAVSAKDGASATYNMFGPLPGSSSGTFENFYISRRNGAGWAASPTSPPQDPVPGGTGYPLTEGFSADLSKTIVMTGNPTPTPDALPNVASLYVRDNNTGAYRLLTPGPASATFSPFETFAGASDDFTHIVFEALDPLVPGAPDTGVSGAYEWVDGNIRNVGVLPNGTPASVAIVGAQAQSLNRVTHAVSADGRRIVFWGDGQLYVREDGATTVPVSASRRGTVDPNGPRNPTFWAASADGGRVFFTSSEALTDDATTGDDGSGNLTDAGNDLYMYDMAGDDLTDLSVDVTPADASAGAQVQGVVGTSDDGTYVYFVALGDLDDGATSGAPNLYVWHGNEVKFIRTLDFGDAANWGIVQRGVSGITSRVTPDGRSLVFPSVARLTGYDNTIPATGAPASEIFRYAAASGDVTCLSCHVDGGAPSGNSTITPPDFLTNIPRNISDDGRRIFFDSADDILPQDTNGRTDVYEYVDGSLQLVSTGTSRFDTTFQDASATGDDVIIATRAQLVPQDIDQYIDLYDARVGGGFPPPPPVTPPCEGDACQGPASPGTSFPVAASVTFAGPGSSSVLSPAPAARRVTVSKPKAVSGLHAKLRIKVPAKGALSVSGAGLATARKQVAKAGTVSITVSLTKHEATRLKRSHQVSVKARVTFKPTGGRSSTATVSLTFKQAKTTKKGRS
jgi:hypothetical protein